MSNPMGPSAHWLLASSVLFPLALAALGADSNHPSLDSLTAVVRDSAFDELAQRRTGVACQVPLPPVLAGVTASAVRMRNGNLWSYGARVGSIRIPPMATTVPFVRRLAIVRLDLGNVSRTYFDMPGYSLVAPVVGFLAYDASSNATADDGAREIELRVLGQNQMVSITFPEVQLPAEPNAMVMCARLGPGGPVQLFGTAPRNACLMKSTGLFAIVVQTTVAPGPQTPVLSAKATAEEETRTRAWPAVASVGAAVGLILVGFAGVGILTWARRNRRAALSMKAEEDEELNTVWAGRSKMPAAAMSRTAPIMENDTAP